MKVLIFLILLTSTIYPTTYADQKLIESICKSTTKYQVCTATLQADPASATADKAGLALIIVKAMKSKVEEALSNSNRLLNKSGKPNRVPGIHHCSDMYDIVLKVLLTAVNAITVRNREFAIYPMQDTMNYVSSCNMGFKGQVAPPPLGGLNKVIGDLAEVNLEIIKKIL